MEEIFVPALGMAMEAATLVDWLKQPGDPVEAGEAVAEIETDKSTLELAATTSGRLGAHRAERGESVAVGSTVTVVLTDGEDERAADDLAHPPPADDGAVTAPPGPAPGTEETTNKTQPAQPVAPAGRAPHRMSPRQRRLAAQAGTAPAVAQASDASDVRQSIARQVSRSWAEIPHFAVARDVDADGVLERLSTETDADSGRVSVTDLLIRALGTAVAQRGASDVGLAVATQHGVLLPVLPDVANRTLGEIGQLRRAAVDRARDRRSTEADTRTPIVTLSNLGTHGVQWFTGIVPLGQQALLTVGTLEQRPVVRNGRLAVAWQLSAVLNVDHRIWDGADAAHLLDAFARHIAAYGRYDDEG